MDDARPDPSPSSRGAEGSSANPGYALGQLARVLATSQEHPDAATRERATRRAGEWLRIFGGMLSGALRIGSRTPVRDTPAWATLRVAQGGFATGDILAGGPLQPHEEALLSTLSDEQQANGRAALNAYYLTEQGMADLSTLLETGHYRVHLPEEGALLVVAWLAQDGQSEAAWHILDEIGPYFPTLRFYPVPSSEASASDERIRLLDVGDAVRHLEAVRPPAQILTQHEAFTVWLPYTDRLVALFAETVSGAPPRLVSQDADGTSVVEGGWPCQVFPPGWTTRAQTALADYERLRSTHTRCGKPDRSTSNLARLRAALAIAADDPARLTGRDVGRVRATLAWIRAKRGLPGSERLDRLRAEQARVAALPLKADWSQVLAHRLDASHSRSGGLDVDRGDLEAALAPVTPSEAASSSLAAGADFGGPFRAQFADLLRRAADAPPERHIAWGTISSAEMLAQIVPRLAAPLRSSGLADPALRRLDEALYQAFRRRRSVLLLDLQHQVKLRELPWVEALEPLRASGSGASASAARAVLARVVTLSLTAFPHQIFPNALLQEIRALLQAADLQVPIVDEVAADIFMGTFTEKYLRAAQEAGRLLEGSLYARYYDIDYSYIRAVDDVRPSRYGPPTSSTFDRLCHERVAQRDARRWRSVAQNGAVIEQEQVLTTHNLAPLFDALCLAEALGERLAEMAQRCFTWICMELQRLPEPSRRNSWTMKNAAYAWRQMVFFLTLLPGEQVQAFLAWAEETLLAQPEPIVAILRPHLMTLAEAARGSRANVVRGSEWEPPFYGWAVAVRRIA